MSLDPSLPGIEGRADERVLDLVRPLQAHLDNDPDFSFQAAAYFDGETVLDVWGGPHLRADSMLVPYSVTKATIGFTTALLVERGELDLDARVADYWPEFAARGKDFVTVRMLLSHQAGLPQATPRLTWAELLDHHAAASRLAETRPLWRPGTAFGYHAMTIGSLASELVFRITGCPLQEFYEREIREPNAIEFYLGLPPELDGRRVPVLPFVRPTLDPPRQYGSAITPLVMGPAPDGQLDLANDEASWRFGHPAGSGVGSARGIAQLYASAVTGLNGRPGFLSAETVEVFGEQQVRGYDEVLGQPHRAHSIVFQKPTPDLAWGGPRSFGHDGALGGLGCLDPDTGVAFGWTVTRAPWPGGADPRALALARGLNARFGG